MSRETQPSPANGGRPWSDQDGEDEPGDQLLEDSQEKVFPREEVMLGRIEHQIGAGSGRAKGDAGGSNRGVGQEKLTRHEPRIAHAPRRHGSGASETLSEPKRQQRMQSATSANTRLSWSF